MEFQDFFGRPKTSEPQPDSPVIPYPAIEQHGIIGDRRTAGLIAADGTLDWLCLADYDGPMVFGALLDWAQGGYWRLGPVVRAQGEQSYVPGTMVLETRWSLAEGTVVLWDAMIWPETGRAPEQEPVRAIVRRLRCTEGKVACRFDLIPRYNFEPASEAFAEHAAGFSMRNEDLALRAWASSPLRSSGALLQGEMELSKDQEIWSVMESGAAGHGWSTASARKAIEQTQEYWRDWGKRLKLELVDTPAVRQSAMLVHLLTYAPQGSVVAAPTTSIPERIGGNWNADYRYCWIRDACLSLGVLGRLGEKEQTEQFLNWVGKRQSRFGHPLQTLYDIRGGKRPSQRKIQVASGYRGSKPVRVGNHAYKQHQFGSLGFLVDCTWVYVQHGGPWREDYWRVIRRAADYVMKHWSEPDNGIWELAEPQQFVHSKVLCWVALDRASKIAHKMKDSFDTSVWQSECAKIHDEVMEKGWSERLGSFRQRYDGDNPDAAELLIPIMGFLPAEHPRVLGTIDCIAQRLTIDEWVYRFNPMETPGVHKIAMGEMEGAFLPCTFWLATALAKVGQIERANLILNRLEKVAGERHLFAEGVDPRNRSFMGNAPLLFSHMEYVRAKLEVAVAAQKADTAEKAA